MCKKRDSYNLMSIAASNQRPCGVGTCSIHTAGFFSSMQSSGKALQCGVQSEALVCGLPGDGCQPLACY